MALIDANDRLSVDQAVTSSAASTYYIDGRAAGDALESNLYFVAKVGTAFAGGTSLEIQLQTAADSTFSSPVTLYDSGAILLANLTANSIQVKAPLPIGFKRYVRAYYTVSGTMTAGTINAFLQQGVCVSE